MEKERMTYKRIFISMLVLIGIEFALGHILKYSVNKIQQNHIGFYDITKIVATSIAMFILINIVSTITVKLYQGSIIIRIIRYFFLVGSIIIIFVVGIGIRSDIYNIIGIMLIIPVLITSILWVTHGEVSTN